MSRTLQDMGSWRALPASCSTALYLHSPARACNGVLNEVSSLSHLQRLWVDKHVALRKAAPKKIKGVRESPCLQDGSCHCRLSPSGLTVHKMWQLAKKALQTSYKRQLERWLSADIVLVWLGHSVPGTLGAEVMEKSTVFLTHVALMYRKPWRPTFVALSLCSADDEKILRQCLSLTVIEPATSFEFVNVCVHNAAPESRQTLCIRTQYEQMGCLDASLCWSVAICHLSDRLCPYIRSSGKVKLAVRRQVPQVFWSGVKDVPKPSCKRPRVEEEDEDDLDSSGEEADQDTEVADNLLDLGLDAELLRMWKEAEQKGDVCHEADSDLESNPEHMQQEDTLVEAQAQNGPAEMEVLPPAAKEDTAGVDASPSSTSSTSSSTSSGSEKGKPTKRTKARNLVYGIHHLVPRIKEGVVIGYQLSCNCAGHKRCSKEMGQDVAGDLAATRIVLKSWSLLGHGMKSREEHMEKSLRQSLLSAMREGQLHDEKTLDKMAPSSATQAAESPFKPLPAVHSLSSSISSSSSVLGQAAPGVPPALHEEMCRLAAEGRIPKTTLAQRKRSCRSSGCTYGVPKQLACALEHSYIHPNFPAPLGYIWRAQQGTWKLEMRGG
eukprot:6471521-Amphidinium_carterae.1